MQHNESNILYAENDYIRMAYVYTDDPQKIGTIGCHGPDQIFVEYLAWKEKPQWVKN